MPATTTFAPKKSEIVWVSATMLPCASTTESDVVLGDSCFAGSPAVTFGVIASGSISAARRLAYGSEQQAARPAPSTKSGIADVRR